MIFVASRCHVGHNGYQTQIVQPRQARGGPDQLTMPDHDAGRRQCLDRCQGVRTKQPLKAIQRALAVEHQAHDCAFCRWLAAAHRRERSRAEDAATGQNPN